MSHLLRIGYFSLVSQVPIKTLRYYDEVGLLKPSHTDRTTGYRYYNSAQLSSVHRILALKDLGFSLEQIRATLNQPLSDGQFLSLLLERRSDLVEELKQQQMRLERLEARIQLLSSQRENSMYQYEVVLKRIKPILVASHRIVVPQNDQVPQLLGQSYKAIRRHVEQQKGKIIGPCFAVWYSPSDQFVNEEVEPALPLAHPVDSGEHVRVYELPEIEAASVVHQGKFDDFTNCHPYIIRWAERNGYEIGDQYREIYVSGADRNNSTTEVQFAVSR